MATAAGYNKTQTFADGKKVVQTVADSSLQVSLEAEFAAIQSSLSATPAIYTSGTLSLQGDLDFGDTYSISNIQDIAGERFYLDGFGATGDGAADDRAAFISAINAAYASGGGWVVLAGKNYRIASTIASTDVDGLTGVGFVGVGATSVIEKDTVGSTDLFDFGANPAIFRNLKFSGDSGETGGSFIVGAGSDTLLRDLIFTGGGTMSGAFAMDTGANNNVTIENIFINGAYDDDIVTIQNCRSARLAGFKYNISSGTPASLLRFSGAATQNDGTHLDGMFVQCSAGSSGAKMLWVSNSHAGKLTLSNLNIECLVSPSDCINIDGASNVVIHGAEIFANTTHADANGVNADNSTECTLTGVNVRGGASAAGAAFSVEGATRLVVSGGNLRDFASGELFNGNTGSTCTTCLFVGTIADNIGTVTLPTGMVRTTGTGINI